MIVAFEALRDEFRACGVNGISMVLVCAAILFCIAENDNLEPRIRKLTKYEMLFFILLANPFGYNIIRSFWMEEYWKMFMVLLPVVFVTIPIILLITEQQKVWKSVLMAICCASIVVSSSFFDLDIKRIDVIKDAYRVENEVADVDEVIRTTGINPEKMIAPREVCARIREINPGVELLYGEDLIERMIDKTAVSDDEEEQQFIDACTTIVAVPAALDHQILVADTYGSNCILLENSYDDEKVMKSAGFMCYGRTENYAVYFRE